MWNTTQFYAYSNRIGIFRKIPYLIKRTIGQTGCYTKMSVLYLYYFMAGWLASPWLAGWLACLLACWLAYFLLRRSPAAYEVSIRSKQQYEL